MDLAKTWRVTNIYNVMIAALVVIAAYSVYTFGAGNLPQMIVITVVAAALDAAIIRIKGKRFLFPKSAIITGLILSLIIQGDPLVLALVAAAAVFSKHVIKIRGKHIFNPANFGLFIALFLPLSESWWGTENLILVGVLGLIIIFKFKRMCQAFAFLAVHAALMLAYFSINGGAQQIILHILSGSMLFFAFYMLIEPVTSSVMPKSRIAFAAIVGILAAVLYVVWLPGMLVGALFLGNLLVPVFDKIFGHK